MIRDYWYLDFEKKHVFLYEKYCYMPPSPHLWWVDPKLVKYSPHVLECSCWIILSVCYKTGDLAHKLSNISSHPWSELNLANPPRRRAAACLHLPLARRHRTEPEPSDRTCSTPALVVHTIRFTMCQYETQSCPGIYVDVDIVLPPGVRSQCPQPCQLRCGSRGATVMWPRYQWSEITAVFQTLFLKQLVVCRYL